LRAFHPIILAGMFAATPALAQQAAGPSDEDLARDSVTVGIAASYMTDYEGADHYSFFPLPGAIGSVGGHSFTVIGNRASVDLIRNQPGPRWDVQLGPIAVVNFNRNSRGAINDPQVRALPKRGLAVELGGYVGIGKTGVVTSPYDKLSISVSYRHDVTGVHDSAIVAPTVNYMTPLSRKTAVALFVSAEHADLFRRHPGGQPGERPARVQRARRVEELDGGGDRHRLDLGRSAARLEAGRRRHLSPDARRCGAKPLGQRCRLAESVAWRARRRLYFLIGRNREATGGRSALMATRSRFCRFVQLGDSETL